MTSGRVEALRSALAVDGRAASMLVSDPSNIRWLTGFTGSSGSVVVTAGRVVLVTDGRYTDQARRQLDDVGLDDAEVVTAMSAAAMDAEVARLADGEAVGAEAARLSHARWAALAEHASPVAADGLLEGLRRHKTTDEVAMMERAASIASAALAEVAPMLVAGVRERDIRDELEYRMRRLGADGPSYETIVASGPDHAARPHQRPTDRELCEGDWVIIDVGALLHGYHSDMTRTFCVGAPSAEQLRWYTAVAESQAAGLAAVGDGVPAREVDAACREVLEAHGLGEFFIHGTGHGVGLDIHEDPFVARTSAAILRTGDVVTVEPGAYRVGTGGVRIEDLVLVTDDGHRPLTSFPKDDPCPPSPPTI